MWPGFGAKTQVRKNRYVWLIQTCQWISKNSASIMLKKPPEKLQAVYILLLSSSWNHLPLKTICDIRNRNIFFSEKHCSKSTFLCILWFHCISPRTKLLWTILGDSGMSRLPFLYQDGHADRGGSQHLTGSQTQIPSISLVNHQWNSLEKASLEVSMRQLNPHEGSAPSIDLSVENYHAIKCHIAHSHHCSN